MKSKKQVLADNPTFKTLINAVVSGIGGVDSISDVNAQGIDGGFGSFIYYSDTCAFFKRHKKAIMRMAEEMASDLGEGGVLEMIQNFNCLSSGQYPNRKPEYTQTEIAQAIYSGKGENVTAIQNALAWFAAEEVCRMFEN